MKFILDKTPVIGEDLLKVIERIKKVLNT